MTPSRDRDNRLGDSIYSRNDYVEYQPGDLNVVLSVPHGGRLKPATIPDRDAGVFVNGKETYDHSIKVKDVENLAVRQKSDIYTVELSLMVADELERLTGKRPHIVICQLYRAKMDANCAMEKATFNIPEAVEAWNAFHGFIDRAKNSIVGPGLFLDIHGQGHPEEWVELGYTIPAGDLNAKSYTATRASLESLVSRRFLKYEQAITGPDSLGTLLEAEGYRTVPSAGIPGPGDGNYYSGGYNTEIHGSRDGGVIDAVQIECPKYVRNPHTAPMFAASLAKAIHHFLQIHFS